MYNNLLFIKIKYRSLLSYMLRMRFIPSNLDEILTKSIYKVNLFLPYVVVVLLYARKIEFFVIFLSSKLARDRLEIVTSSNFCMN
jgi:hypothetical protein